MIQSRARGMPVRETRSGNSPGLCGHGGSPEERKKGIPSEDRGGFEGADGDGKMVPSVLLHREFHRFHSIIAGRNSVEIKITQDFVVCCAHILEFVITE